MLRSLNKWCGYFWDIGTKFNVICGVPMVGILVGVGGAGVVIMVVIVSSLPTMVLNRENPKKIALRGH